MRALTSVACRRKRRKKRVKNWTKIPSNAPPKSRRFATGWRHSLISAPEQVRCKLHFYYKHVRKHERHIRYFGNFFFTDDGFLLRFLRASKFSQLRAQEVLENYWTVRSVESKGAPDWFRNLTPQDPKIQEVLDQAWVNRRTGRKYRLSSQSEAINGIIFVSESRCRYLIKTTKGDKWF